AQNLGAGNTKRVKQGYSASMKLVLVFVAVVSVLIWLFGKYFIMAFMDAKLGETAIANGIEYLKIVSIFYFIFGIMCVTNGILRGAGDMKAFMASTLVNITGRIVFAYALAPIMGYQAIFWSIPLGWALAAVISFLRYISGKWKNVTVISKKGEQNDTERENVSG
ncbi:MAG: MATE family efflux transporter, partial [Oscillospiraceae bacterium]